MKNNVCTYITAYIPDDTAMQLLDDIYAGADVPPAYVWKRLLTRSSLLRRLLCLSLCTEMEDDHPHTLSLHATTLLSKRSRTVARFQRPSAMSIQLARVLLERMIPLCTDPILPGSSDTHKNLREKAIQSWVSGPASADYASTPLAFWADTLLLGAFATLWDLLMQSPTTAARRLDVQFLTQREFWQGGKDQSARLVEQHLRFPQLSDREEDLDPSSDVPTLTQGAWRTLRLLLSLWKQSDTFFDSSFAPLDVPIRLVFSFPHEKSFHVLTLREEDNIARLYERANIAVQLLAVLSCHCASNLPTLYQRALPFLARLPILHLEVLCDAASTELSFQNICYAYLYSICTNAQIPVLYLYENSRRPDMDLLTQLLHWPCHAKFQSTKDSRSSSSDSLLPSLITWYKSIWLKWYLWHGTAAYRAGSGSSVLPLLKTDLQELLRLIGSNFTLLQNSVQDKTDADDMTISALTSLRNRASQLNEAWRDVD